MTKKQPEVTAQPELNPKTLKTENRVWETTITADGEVVNKPPEDLHAQLPQEVESPINFTMYCQLRNFPVLHRAGLRAFTKVQSAQAHAWDQIFKNY